MNPAPNYNTELRSASNHSEHLGNLIATPWQPSKMPQNHSFIIFHGHQQFSLGNILTYSVFYAVVTQGLIPHVSRLFLCHLREGGPLSKIDYAFRRGRDESCCLRAGMQFVSSMSQRLSGMLSTGLSPQAALRKTPHVVYLRKPSDSIHML